MNATKNQLPTKTIFNLSEMISYEEDMVKSKTILNKGPFSITVFAFYKEQGISAHTSPFDAFVHILEGDAEITISGEKFNLHAGEIINMPANEPHALEAVSNFKMALFMMKS